MAAEGPDASVPFIRSAALQPLWRGFAHRGIASRGLRALACGTGVHCGNATDRPRQCSHQRFIWSRLRWRPCIAAIGSDDHFPAAVPLAPCARATR